MLRRLRTLQGARGLGAAEVPLSPIIFSPGVLIPVCRGRVSPHQASLILKSQQAWSLTKEAVLQAQDLAKELEATLAQLEHVAACLPACLQYLLSPTSSNHFTGRNTAVVERWCPCFAGLGPCQGAGGDAGTAGACGWAGREPAAAARQPAQSGTAQIRQQHERVQLGVRCQRAVWVWGSRLQALQVQQAVTGVRWSRGGQISGSQLFVHVSLRSTGGLAAMVIGELMCATRVQRLS